MGSTVDYPKSAEEGLADFQLEMAGEALMPLEAYPFRKRYRWVKDRYGLTWQLILTDTDGEPRSFIWNRSICLSSRSSATGAPTPSFIDTRGVITA